MPLFAHWRHTPVFSGVKRGCGGGAQKQKKENGVVLDDAEPTAIFCHHDLSIENKLMQMHALQRAGDKTIQCEIDRYLIACISSSLAHLVLPRNCIAHYDNLPDISAYALGILDPTMDSEVGLQQVLLLLRQCIPLRRRTKRAQREVQWREESCFAMQTLVRCMQGTLLGLYPNSLKVIAFGARIGVWRLLRSMLVLTFEKLHRCMQKIPYIIKLCCMEHLCNTIYDYHPGICHTLNQSGQKVEHFCNSVSTICDIFRGELNTMYCAAETVVVNGKRRDSADVVVGILTPLEKIAHSYFERCTRAYRGIIIGNIQQIKSVDHAKRLMIPAVIPYIGFILENIHTACNQSVFDMVHAGKLPRHLIELAWYITQTIQVHSLPQCIAKKQLIALGNRYSGDTTCIAKCRVMYICVQCAIKKGSAYGMRLRHDCRTNALLCIHCGPGTVLTIDMLGRMLVVAGERVILSSCCGSFVYYSGSGFEYSTECGVQCCQNLQFHKKKEKPSQAQQSSAASTAKGSKRKLDLPSTIVEGGGSSGGVKEKKNIGVYAKNPRSHTTFAAVGNGKIGKLNPNWKICIICKQKNIQQSLPLLDIHHRAIVQHPLCAKHVIPHHVCKSLWDLDGIYKFFNQRNSSSLSSCDNDGNSGVTSGGVNVKTKFKKKK
jgi:hypothetical protein